MALQNQKDNAAPEQVYLPLSLFYPVGSDKGFSSGARVFFQGQESVGAESAGIKFFQGALVEVNPIREEEGPMASASQSTGVPYFSLAAIFALIIFRNRFYGAFTKYFLSLKNNYEIDFNFQRIGFVPILFCILVIFLSTADLLKTNYAGIHGFWQQISEIRSAFILLGFPILVSCLLFFILDFSGKIFPLIFSDLKVLFYLSLLVLIWNFSAFGAGLEKIISKEIFILSLAALYLIFRSFFFFNVFIRAFRFRIPISLFYICALNLTAFFFLTKGLPKDFFRFL